MAAPTGAGGGRFLAPSRYDEDRLEAGHAAVFGSFYDRTSAQWGFACCQRLGRGAICGLRGRGPAAPDRPAPPRALEAGPPALGPRASDRLDPALGSSSSSEEEADEDEDGGAAPAGAAPAGGEAAEELVRQRLARALAEADRILAAPGGCHLEVLGLRPPAEPAAVRRAFRRIALVIHPDKNPGAETRCKEALLRAQGSREALEAQLGTAPEPGPRSAPARGAGDEPPGGGAAPDRAEGRRARRQQRRRTDASGVPGDLDEHRAARPREAFDSAEDFVVHALLHCLARWRAPGAEASSAAAAAAARSGVVASQAAFGDTAASVAALRRLLEGGNLGPEPVAKLEKICLHVLAQEYVPANQAYLDLSIGSRTWHAEVPSLLEGGCSWGGSKAGKERGQLFKQARTAQRLNSERAASATLLDDEAVKVHLTSLKRLLTVMQELQPQADPSRNCL